MEDYRKEGETCVKEISDLLEQVETTEDLSIILPKLKALFNELVSIIIAAYECCGHYPVKFEPSQYSYLESHILREEMHRISRIPGALLLLERAQEDALNQLDGYEKRWAKRKLCGSQ